MRSFQGAFVIGAGLLFLSIAASASAVVVPMTLGLTPAGASANRLNVTVDLNPYNLGNKSQTKTTDASGDLSANIDILFDPTSHEATVAGIGFIYERPGHISFTPMSFSYSWIIAGAKLDMTSVKVTAYTPPLPPPPPLTPVAVGEFPGDQIWAEFNGGSLTYQGTGLASSFSGLQDFSTDPLSGQNTGTGGPGTIAISSPTMNGTVGTYSVTVLVPLTIDQTMIDPDYVARVRANGKIQATGTFQYDFSPRVVNWAVASGDFPLDANWDSYFAPRSIDTARIANGGTATLSAAFPNAPEAVWVGGTAGVGTLTVAASGSLECGALTLAKDGGTGTLNLHGGTLLTNSVAKGTGTGVLSFDGGTLRAKGDNDHFLEGLSTARIRAGGAKIDTDAFRLVVAQLLVTDAGSPGGRLTKQGSGTLLLTANNTYTGGTTIEAGTLQLGSGGTAGAIVGEVLNNGTLVINRSNSLQLSGVISGSGGVIQAGTGATYLSATNTYAGGTIIKAGTLHVTAAGQLGTGPVTLDGGIFRAAATFTRTGSLNVGAAGGTVDSGSYTVTFTSPSTGGGNLTKIGTGLLVVEGGLGALGDVVVNGGTLRPSVGAIDSLGAATTLTIAANATVDESWGNGETFGTLAGAGTFIGRGGPNDADEHLHIDIGGNNQDTTFSGRIRAGINGVVTPGGILSRLTKNGTGTLTLSGATSDFAGPVQINNGTLSINSLPNRGSDGPLGRGAASGADVFLGSAGTGATLLYTGATASSDRTFDLQAGGGIVNVSDAEAILRLTNGISGAGSLTKTGPGALALSGAGTYAGGTRISAGTLEIGSALGLPSGGGLTIETGATVVLAGGISEAVGASSVTAVPEPNAFLLLIVATMAGACAWLTRRAQGA